MAKKVTKNRKQAEQAAAKRRHLRIVAGIIMVAAAGGLACGGLVWYQHDQKAQQQAPDSADYADVLQSYYTAVFAADGQTLTQLMAPPEYWTYYMETYNKTEEDVIDSFAEGCSNTVSEWKETYGDDVKVTYQIEGLSEQGDSGVSEWNSNMEEMLGNDGADISQAVTLEVQRKFQGSNDSGTDVVYPTLGKIGEKWYIISEDDDTLKSGAVQTTVQ